jgi:regulator of sigma E protease
MTFLSAIFLLGVLIFVHELGHFLFAKAMRVRVLKFSLGFGPKVLAKKYGETEYIISSIPMGGYVKMFGEEQGEQITEEEKVRAFNFQPVWKRVLIVLFGPLFNIFFASFVLFFVFLAGVPTFLPEVGEVLKDSPAAHAGLMKGDLVIAIDGRPIKKWEEMTDIIYKSPGKKLRMTVKRGGRTVNYEITPERKLSPDIFGEKKEVGLIGIRPSGSTFVEREGMGGAFDQALKKTWDISALTAISIVKLIQRVIPADTIGGPILIFQMAGREAAQGALSFFVFMAVISINLGILNLLPIPILDGGHILFLGIEAVRRRPLSEKVIMIAQRVGLAIIVTLIVYAFYNDIMRLITGKTILQ